MKLPGNAIGISDLLAYRDCPRGFSYGMRRHVGVGAQDDHRTPEAGSPQTAYGSAIHGCIRDVENGDSDEDAITRAFRRWGRRLEPDDRRRLADDLGVYRARDATGVRTIAAEDEFRVPLFRHNGELVYFRFLLDRLYERVDAPGHFIHVDYKSSRWWRTQADVDRDLQMWAYNWGIFEFFPECVALEQVYDQLRHGQLRTRKTEEQRAEIRPWLIDTATAILEDEDYQPDGLLPHTFNQWCPWCPVLESCPVIGDLTDFALTRIAALAPTHQQGRRRVVELDPDRVQEYAGHLETVKTARAVLKRFDDSVRGLLRELPDERRRQLGFGLQERTSTVYTPEAIRAMHARLGARFYDVVGITQTRLESALGDDAGLLQWALGLAERQAGTTSVVHRQEAA